jgi:hypothetical protein
MAADLRPGLLGAAVDAVRRFLHTAFAPWVGLFLGALAWLTNHQVGSSLSFADCRLGGPMLSAGLGLACGLLSLAGAAVSWMARGPGNGRRETRTFAAWISIAAAGLFLLAIVLQTAAGFILPDCHR